MVDSQPSYEFVVSAEDADQRLDHFLTLRQLPHTRSRLKQFIDGGGCEVNGQPARPSSKVRAGDVVVLTPPPPEPSAAIPEQIPLCVLYEDEHLIVVDKPSGMVVHPAPGHSRGTLVNALLGHCALSDAGDALRPGIVHRLDRDTSGVMVATKTDEAQAGLSRQFADHTIERRYLVVVSGRLSPRSGTMDTLHGRHPHHRKRFSTRVKRGRRAVTHWRVLATLSGATLVEARLETGRTHQVRVHFADAGFPVLGDQTYARAPSHEGAREQARALGRQALHARRLGFMHPVTGQKICFETPPPPDMAAMIEALAGDEVDLGPILQLPASGPASTPTD